MSAWPVIGIIVLIFAIWVATGGPDRPISFSGPFITPLTEVGDTQVGYGEEISIDGGTPQKSDSNLWSVKSIFGRFEGAVDSGEEVGVVSPHADRVTISSGAGGPSGSNPRQEYVALQSESDSSVDITGWRLVSTKSGASGLIPAATLAPRSGGPYTNVVLAPGDEAIVTTGSSPVGSSFRENKCTSYLDRGDFVPALGDQGCPSPEEELGDFYTGSASVYDACGIL